MSSAISIPLYDSNRRVFKYITTEWLATIIDYGTSFAETTNEIKLGYPKLSSGQNGLKPFPLFDLYKLICFCYQEVLFHHKTQAVELEQYFMFFNQFPMGRTLSLFGIVSNALDEYARSRKINYYTLNNNWRVITWTDYIKYIQVNNAILADCTNDIPENSTLYQRRPTSIEEFMNQISDPNQPLTSTIQFCIAHHGDPRADLRSRFDMNILNQTFNKINNLSLTTTGLMRTMPPHVLNTVEGVKDQLRRLIIIMNKLRILDIEEEGLKCVSKNYWR
jgi:hypothetical protein